MERSGAINASMPEALTQASAHERDPRAAGQALEGMFASLLIKQMRQTLDSGLFGKDPSDVLGGLFDHFLGTHIAQSGGFGVADMVRMQLERRPERT